MQAQGGDVLRRVENSFGHEEGILGTEVTVITKDGVGFGDGSIGTATRLERGDLTAEAVDAAIDIVCTSEQAFVDVDPAITDDGCGDGRPVVETWVTDDEGNEIHYSKSYARAKLFGGGLVVGASMWRAINGTPEAGMTVLGDRSLVASELEKRGIKFGAHCDSHASGDACGCGAIDQYPAISAYVVKYKQQILDTLKAVFYKDAYGDVEPAVEQVIASYELLAANETYFSNASGAQTMDLLADVKTVIKKLDGEHKEAIVVLNDVEGTTLDQPRMGELLRSRGVTESVQAFAVDTWRGRMYADALAQIAHEHGVSEDIGYLKQVAYADFLIRTLAVAAKLTAGDLPVIARTRAGQQNFALAS